LATIPALGVLAGATRTLRLGTFVIANDSRNPVLLAREAATLDFLSGGRFELGLGAGRPGAEEDNRKLGMPFDSAGVRIARLAESIRIVKALFAGETVDAPGPYYRAAGADLFPRPVQEPRPPILVAAGGPRLLALAAREADIVTIAAPPLEAAAGFEQRVETLRQAAPERFDHLELSMNLLAVGGTPHPIVARGIGVEQLLRSGSPAVLTGSPDEMAEQVQRSRETLGISYVTVWQAFADQLAPVVERLAGR
ncbi:MAG TPA: TIGR03621 family F420-dependent LLM class oxidoreductase, partial [Candidatus Dormibacteraeota bacterium]